MVGDWPAIVPELSGTAFLTGEHTFILEPRDQVPKTVRNRLLYDGIVEGAQVIPDAPLRAFLEHHGFRTLLSRLGQVADAPVAEPAGVPTSRQPASGSRHEGLDKPNRTDRRRVICRVTGHGRGNGESRDHQPVPGQQDFLVAERGHAA